MCHIQIFVVKTYLETKEYSTIPDILYLYNCLFAAISTGVVFTEFDRKGT